MIRGALSGLLVGALRRRGAAFGPGSGVGGGPSTSLDLNFIAMAASQTLDPRITFSRGTLATLTNAAGNVAYAPHNFCAWSEQFNRAGWTTTSQTVALSSGTAPDGNSTANRLTASAGSSVKQTYWDSSSPTTVTTNSVYAKAGTASWIALALDIQGVTDGAFFNLANGTVGTVAGGTTASITSVGNGWYRCSVTRIYTSANHSLAVEIHTADAQNPYWTAAGTETVYVWGAQANQGALQNYFPTNGSVYHGPRFTYDQITHASLGLLIEEQRTNFALYSKSIGGTGWITSGALTVTANAVAGPMGGMTAIRIQTTGLASVYQNVTVTASTAYAFTFYVRNNGGTLAEYSVYDVTHAANIYAETTYLSSINGSTWTRVTVSFTTPAGCVSANIYPIRATGAGADLYLDCAQLEAGAFATSYIPTTTATVTRAADSATMTGSNFSSWFNATQGTFVAKFVIPPLVASTYKRVFSARNVADTERLEVWVNGAGTVRIGATTGGVTTETSLVAAVTAGQVCQVALAYTASTQTASLNGAAVISQSSSLNGAAFTVLDIGQYDLANILNAPIARLRYYNTALTNAQLQALTT